MFASSSQSKNESSIKIESQQNTRYNCQVRLLKKCKFLIEKDHSEKEMAVQVTTHHGQDKSGH